MNKRFNARQQLVIDKWAGDAKSTAAACGLTEKTVRNILRSFWVWNAIAYPKDPFADLRLVELLWRKQIQDPAITGCHRNAAYREYFKVSAMMARAEGWMPHGNKGRRKSRQPAKGAPPVPSTPQGDTRSLLDRIKALMAAKDATATSATADP